MFKLRNFPRNISFYLIINLVLFTSFFVFPERPQENISNTTLTILLWNKFFNDERWDLPRDTIGPTYLENNLQCTISDCIITNEGYLLQSVDMFDALLFHVPNIYRSKSFPATRNPNQLYIFAMMESPAFENAALADMQNVFNLTLTYRLDSDILWPYGMFEDIATNDFVAPGRDIKWRQPPMNFNDTDLWLRWSMKTRNIAWFVSNCETPSHRERIVNSLSQYIDVDIYGNCANNQSKRCEKRTTACDDLLDKEYKFYLAFENSLCTDYVTEKLYNALERDVIPVVFGGANYTNFAPPQSYINAQSFESVEKLATFLKKLGSDPEEYLKHFWWRSYYKIHVNSVFCRLCEKLHKLKHETHIYKDMKVWWQEGACTENTRIKF